MNAIVACLALTLATIVALALRPRKRFTGSCTLATLRSLSANERVLFAEGLATEARANRLASYYEGERKRASDRAQDIARAASDDDAALSVVYRPCYCHPSRAIDELPCLCKGCN
jgi:hypothetical protein